MPTTKTGISRDERPPERPPVRCVTELQGRCFGAAVHSYETSLLRRRITTVLGYHSRAKSGMRLCRTAKHATLIRRICSFVKESATFSEAWCFTSSGR